MGQPSIPGPGAGDQPARDPGLHGDTGPGSLGGAAEADRRTRTLRLSDFATGGTGEACPPGPDLAAALAALSGPGWRCLGASDEELIGLLSRWAAVESWAAAGKLGVLRELLRRRAGRMPGPGAPGELPRSWHEGTGHEVAAALAVSVRGADKLLDLAWELGARLPGIAALLAEGAIDALKARLIADELAVLDDEHAAQAEALIVAELAGKTPGMAGRLAAQAACTVDPEGAARRRERAEREEARVRFWRENNGGCALAAYGLPADEALAAHASIQARARRYKKARVCPDATMDQLRVLAFLDMVNGVSAEARIARARAGQARAGAQAQGGAGNGNGTGGGNGAGAGGRGDDRSADGGPGHDQCPADQDWPADDDDSRGGGDSPGDPGTGDGDGPGGSDGPGGGTAGDGHSPGDGDDRRDDPGGPELAASINLTIPLATVLGQAQRPGLGHGLGPLDPKLARDLAAAAARAPHSTWCVTVTDGTGIAIGHGCARPARKRKGKLKSGHRGGGRDGPQDPQKDGKPAFTPRDDPGPPGGYGTWTLTLPGGQELDVTLLPIPVTDCDHRYESHSYQPSDLLRHLVQVRDGDCTFPCCSRHARESDFEHAIPYEKGGRTCPCNAGARSRRCHKVKQSRGWSVTQPRPGWHQWTTPSGRTYTKGPMKYPV